MIGTPSFAPAPRFFETAADIPKKQLEPLFQSIVQGSPSTLSVCERSQSPHTEPRRAPLRVSPVHTTSPRTQRRPQLEASLSSVRTQTARSSSFDNSHFIQRRQNSREVIRAHIGQLDRYITRAKGNAVGLDFYKQLFTAVNRFAPAAPKYPGPGGPQR